MSKTVFIRLSLLNDNPQYRRLLAARALSLLGLGFLIVAVPIQIYQLTGSTLWVAAAGASDAAGLFLGLLFGGVLADTHDQRKLILLARSVCGVGFAALAINAMFATPSVLALIGLAFIDGFFGAIGVSALMAAAPQVVGRERIVEAGALGMLISRVINIASPALAGLLLAATHVVWAYVIATVSTIATVGVLRGLNPLPPQSFEVQSPLKMLVGALEFVITRRRVLTVFLLGALLMACTGIKVLFPALATDVFATSNSMTGLLFAMGPVGATLAAVFSGWVHDRKDAFRLMIGLSLSGLVVFTAIGVAPGIWAAMILLVVFGYLISTASLLQYGIVQRETPDAFLGRVNSLWLAQDALGDIVGALTFGALASLVMPLNAVLILGLSSLAVMLLLIVIGLILGRGAAPADAGPA
ncbi:enterobactin transporter EntS [Rhodobacteraceae bacterium B1Z28]|uniref:Enterobactin transporter EntS n=1 Tax=Ruegeria haliotis TaxID=2747601 RepID=A0ABX2PT94_9RHOB|nr:enterobactin transporter EntS [Ruegeria haliotis]NVO57356.1 enterobactin transporter EntS [Ruegeria haliotis]